MKTIGLVLFSALIVGCDAPEDFRFYGDWRNTSLYCDQGTYHALCTENQQPAGCVGQQEYEVIGIGGDGDRLYLDGDVSGMSFAGGNLSGQITNGVVTFDIAFNRGYDAIVVTVAPGCHLHYMRKSAVDRWQK